MKNYRIFSIILIVLSALLFTACSSIVNNILFHTDIKSSQKPISGFKFQEGYIKNVKYIYYLSKSKEPKGTIVFFHGNYENIYSLNTNLYFFLNHGYNLFLFDYRGYGKSLGNPTLKGVNEDAVNVLNYTIKNIPKNLKLIIFGQSLGGAVVLRAIKDIQKKERIDAIVIEDSFLSYKQLAKEKFCFTASLLVNDEYSPNQLNPDLKIPLLIIHSKDDNIVPYSQGVSLHKYFSDSFFLKTYGEHISFINNISHRNKLYNFFERKQCQKFSLE